MVRPTRATRKRGFCFDKILNLTIIIDVLILCLHQTLVFDKYDTQGRKSLDESLGDFLLRTAFILSTNKSSSQSHRRRGAS